MKALFEKYVQYIHNTRVKMGELFFTLFDGGKTFAEAKDLARHNFQNMFLPFAKKYLDPSSCYSLDIGYGSAFQVLEASQYFEFSKGVDIHKEAPFILDTFRAKGIAKGISLETGTADNLPEPNDEFGFVHSWVTFLHFPSIEYTKLALKEIFRVLKPGGVAVIYYARLVKTKRMETPAEYEFDLSLEKLHQTGFDAKESLTEPFKKGISIARWKMVELVNDVGFQLLEHTSSNDGGFIYGQHGIVLRKPPIVEPKQAFKPVKRLIQRKPKKSTVSKKQKS